MNAFTLVAIALTLLAMAFVALPPLRAGRDGVALQAARSVACSLCGASTNQHAQKVDYSAGDGGVLQGVHQCAACGNIEMRAVAEVAVA